MSRTSYRTFRTITTRWMDNDAYGHVNNVVYYSWFDTAVNTLLVECGLLDIQSGATIGLVVETGCKYARSVAFPEPVEAGVRIARIGNSSIRWEVGLFTAGHEAPAAEGYFVHVYVDRATRRPQPLPDIWRQRLAEFQMVDAGPAPRSAPTC
jgi:acyl-CoA thioester hydrolase